MSAALDLYRDLRDATAEAAFFQVYGNLLSLNVADQQRVIRRATRFDPRSVPAVRQVLDTLEQGTPAEAYVRIALLMSKAGGGRRKLAQMERVRELVAPARLLDRISEDQFRTLMHEETIVVEFEPERAKRALPKLLRAPRRSAPAHELLDVMQSPLPARRAPARVGRGIESAAAAAGSRHGGNVKGEGGSPASARPAPPPQLGRPTCATSRTARSTRSRSAQAKPCRGRSRRRRSRRWHSLPATSIGFHVEGGDTGDRLSAQGAAAVAIVAGLLNRRLPGPGSAIVGTKFHYAGACRIGDTLTATVTAKARHAKDHQIDFECRCSNQDGDVLVDGVATVQAPVSASLTPTWRRPS